MKKSILSLLVFQLVLVFTLSISYSTAYAYLDPGTGSYVIQLLIAFLVGALFTIKLWFTKVRMFFDSLFSRRRSSEESLDIDSNDHD